MRLRNHRALSTELDECRRQNGDDRPLLVFFSEVPPPSERMRDIPTVEAWLDLLKKQKQLTEGWLSDGSSLLSMGFVDPQGLCDAALDRLESAIADTICASERDSDTTPSSTDGANAAFIDGVPGGAITLEEDLVRIFRRQVVSKNQRQLSDKKSNEAVLDDLGVRSRGRLTYAGALLFTARPDAVLPAAFIRCTGHVLRFASSELLESTQGTLDEWKESLDKNTWSR